MRFGLFLPQGWRLDLVGISPVDQWPAIKALAQRVDQASAWSSLWVYDHFHTTPRPSAEATHEAWSLMAGLGAVTERIRLGQMCTCMSYRPPTYLAKVAATCDHISGGRIEMGIGAGWYEHEWRAYGYGFPRPGVRLGRLDEGVQIFKQAWETGSVTFAGEHYQVDGALVHPRPLQEPRIPLWIAGGGEKVTLRIAAKHADYTNFDGTPRGFARKSQILREHCREVGTDFERIVRSANYNSFIGRDEAEVTARRQAYADRIRPHSSAAQVRGELSSFDGLPGTGTPEQIVENLRALEKLGMTYAIIYLPDLAYDTSGLELFEQEVIPALAD